MDHVQRVRSIDIYLADENGASRGAGPSLLTSINTVEQEMQPVSISLRQNYPNPFNCSTIITFTLPHPRRAEHVSQGVYDLQGRLVTRLVDESLPGGNYSVYWRGTTANGVPVARVSISSGVTPVPV